MATYTPNYNFKKPERTEKFVLSDGNDNWDLADAALDEMDGNKVNIADVDAPRVVSPLSYPLTLLNGVTSPVGAAPSYKKVGGIVFFRGLVQTNSTTSVTQAANFPADFRPKEIVQLVAQPYTTGQTVRWAASVAGSGGYLGNLIIEPIGSGTPAVSDRLMLSGSWPAEQ